MKCPNCNVDLLMTEMSMVSIDYCPQCRGVWLEKGKLDKIIEKSSMNQNNQQSNNGYYHDEDDHDDSHGRHKKRGFFDFFD